MGNLFDYWFRFFKKTHQLAWGWLKPKDFGEFFRSLVFYGLTVAVLRVTGGSVTGEVEWITAVIYAIPVLVAVFYLAAAMAAGPRIDKDLSEQLKSVQADRTDLQARLDVAEEELSKERNNQELADYLTERIKEGTALLNQDLEDRDDLPGWSLGAAGWLSAVLAAMRHHGCTKQEIQRVELLVIFDQIPGLHTDPLINFEKSIHAERLLRVREIAELYAVPMA